MKKTSVWTLILCALFLGASLSAEELYFRFQIKSRSELLDITRLVSIDNVRNDTVIAVGTAADVERIQALGYRLEILPHPSSLTPEPVMANNKEAMAQWDVYPTYDAYVQMMNDFQALYPGLCRIFSAGNSLQGREILFAKISDNVAVEEAEPEVMYTSTMHGDETTGYVLMLRLIDSLLTGYGVDAAVTQMVNGMEIWINPLANPDGTYRSGNSTVAGSTRGNANYVDLNRNFPDPDNGPHPDGWPWQMETVAMMNIAGQHNWVISANFHGGAEVVNYPWDTWFRRHPDDQWYIDVSRQYADSAQAYGSIGYMNDLNNGITNGWDWYPIAGGRQDYMNYYHGCREVTIELSNIKLVPASTLPMYWRYNRVSLFDWLRQANFGIRGIVTDIVSGLPVAATVSVIGHDADSSEVYTDPDVGDYYRMIEPGTYSLRFTADGYDPVVVSDVTVVAGGSVEVNVQMGDVWVCGDVDDNGTVQNILEITYLVDFIFRSGPPPPNMPAADVDGSGGDANVVDLTYMVDYVFRGGPPPVCQ